MNLYAFYKGYLSKENKQSSFGQGTKKLANRTLITSQSFFLRGYIYFDFYGR